MKTAMQELIDWIKEHRDNDKILMQQHVIAKGYQLLEKEKEQIVNAFEVGYKSCDIDEALEINRKLASGEQHYNKTYNL